MSGKAKVWARVFIGTLLAVNVLAVAVNALCGNWGLVCLNAFGGLWLGDMLAEVGRVGDDGRRPGGL